MTTPERFTVLTGGPTSDERDARLAEGADELAGARRGRLLGNDRFLLALAAALMTFGISVILLGWFGAAHSTLVEEQVPYLVSGGLLGLALALIGAVCLLAHWLTVLLREERAREIARREDHAALMKALHALAPTRDDQAGRANGSGQGEPPRRPIRRTPRSS